MEWLEDRRLLSLGDLLHTLDAPCSPQANAQFGYAVTADGDLSVVGAPYADVGGVLATGAVKAHQKISDTEGNFTGTLEYGDLFGLSVANVGDLDGDGVTDLAVGADGDDDGGVDRGAVWMLFLNSDGTVKARQKISAAEGNFTGTLDNSDQFGISVADVGDLDGDGVTDLAVGAFGDDDGGVDRGAVWMLFLNSNGTVKAHQKISDTEGNFTGTLDKYDALGYSVANVGDLDGDGVTDLAVGAPGHDDGGIDRGAVWMLFLNSNGTVKAHQKISDTAGSFTGTLDDHDYFGSSAASVGDLDGDGVTDLAVGADWDDDGGIDRGAVWMLFLNPNGTVKAHQEISDTAGSFIGTLDDYDCFGCSVANVGDLDGDGVTDLAVGAQYDDDGGINRGAVWMLFLAPGQDYGDAPDPSYPTLLASNGARHLIGGPFLGALVDAEPDGQPNATASGDDSRGTPDDEDGVALGTLVGSATVTMTGIVAVDLQNPDSVRNLLSAWIDFNQDGDWLDAGEQILSDRSLGTTAGPQVLSFTIPAGATAGTTYARFRLSTSSGLTPAGPAPDGEVEDYELTVAVDTTPPAADIVDVTPDPRSTDAGTVTISFSEAVTEVDIADFTLTRGGASVDLSGLTVAPAAGPASTYTIDLSSLTATAGTYVLTLMAAGSGIHDTAGNGLAADASDGWETNSTIAGRHLFYNRSKFDGNDPAANAADDAAIAPDKQALLPGGGKAAFKNYTTFSRGLNGLMIDVDPLPGVPLSATDFAFRCGNDDVPAGWAQAANPTTIAVRAGAGTGGSDRVTLIWPDNAIPNANWLQVTVLANAHTGLAANDVFYFGCAIGETGNSTTDAKVNSQDVTRIRNNYTGFGTVGIESVYDFNRDRKVNSQDVTICRNYFSGFTPLKLITPPAAAPAALGGAPLLAAAAAHDAVLRDELAGWDVRLYADLAWAWELERAKPKQTSSQADCNSLDVRQGTLADFPSG